MDDYVNHLFPYLHSERLRKVSCGHVIPKQNLLALTVPSGATGREFEFTFEKRNDIMLVSVGMSSISVLICLIIHRSRSLAELSTTYAQSYLMEL